MTNKAATASLAVNVKEQNVASAALTVDQTGQATTTFEDDKGNTNAPPPAGYDPSQRTSDNPTVATVDATGHVQPLAEGVANITDPVADSTGTPLNTPAGTPFGPVVVAVTVGPGAAIAATEQVTPNP